MYLMTCRSREMTGLYYLPIPTLAHEAGCTTKEVGEALERLRVLEFAHYDDQNEVVYVVNMAREQIAGWLDDKDNRVKNVQGRVSAYMHSPLLRTWLARYARAFHCTSLQQDLARLDKVRDQPSHASATATGMPVHAGESELVVDDEDELDELEQVAREEADVRALALKKVQIRKAALAQDVELTGDAIELLAASTLEDRAIDGLLIGLSARASLSHDAARVTAATVRDAMAAPDAAADTTSGGAAVLERDQLVDLEAGDAIGDDDGADDDERKAGQTARRAAPTAAVADVSKRAMEVLSAAAGRDFRVTQYVRGDIAVLLGEGFSADDIEAVIRAKARQWRFDANMSQQLKPSTLLDREKFERYLEEDVRAGVPMTPEDGWKIVHAEIKRVGGRYGKPSLDPMLMAAVRIAGWGNICAASERDAPRLFMNAFKTAAAAAAR